MYIYTKLYTKLRNKQETKFCFEAYSNYMSTS